jgi:two-component system chemotaxis sensor kinase CheA
LGGEGQWAIQLSNVTRLEEFNADEIEQEGAVPVIQYRGEIMPLVPLCQLLLPAGKSPRVTALDDKLQVIVHSRDGVICGLWVDRIIDIAREPLVLQRKKSRPGILGSMVIQRKVTQVIDIDGLIKLDKARNLLGRTASVGRN